MQERACLCKKCSGSFCYFISRAEVFESWVPTRPAELRMLHLAYVCPRHETLCLQLVCPCAMCQNDLPCPRAGCRAALHQQFDLPISKLVRWNSLFNLVKGHHEVHNFETRLRYPSPRKAHTTWVCLVQVSIGGTAQTPTAVTRTECRAPSPRQPYPLCQKA